MCNPETGKCIDDPCLYVQCPSSEVCRNGNCFSPPTNEEEVPSEETTEGVTEATTEGTTDGGAPEEGSDTTSNKEDVTGEGSSTDKSNGETVADKDPGELPPPPEGCGCNQAPTPAAPLLLILLALAFFSFRRRRA